MRKDALKKLLSKYPSYRGWILKKALEEKPFVELSDDHYIAFHDIVDFFRQNGFEPTISAKEIAKTHSDTDLFYLFITDRMLHEVKEEEKTAGKRKILDNTPQGILDYTLAPLLDAKSVAKISACSSALYQKTKRAPYWRDKLIAIGCNREELDKVIHANVISNYKKLYRNLLRFGSQFIKRLNVWEFFCLSGETIAIIHAVRGEGLTKNVKGLLGRNALHYAALSGSVEAVRFIRRLNHERELKLESIVRDTAGHDAFWYADQSPNAAQIREVLSLPIEKILNPPDDKKEGVKQDIHQFSTEKRSKCVIM